MYNTRLKLFYRLLSPFSNFARKRRSRLFVKKMKPKAGMRILDVGGQPQIWDHIEAPLNITCLNLPGIAVTEHKTHHDITYVEGDGCGMPEFHFGEFDLVFSNSVIEHVGNEAKRQMFASEVRRISKTYWIQTPYKYFPIEAHCGMPFWWLYPKPIRLYLLKRWRKKFPDWTEMVETTTVVSAKELKELFPESILTKEWVIFPKSLIAHSVL